MTLWRNCTPSWFGGPQRLLIRLAPKFCIECDTLSEQVVTALIASVEAPRLDGINEEMILSKFKGTILPLAMGLSFSKLFTLHSVP